VHSAQATTTSRTAVTSRLAIARRNSVSEAATFAAVRAASSVTSRRSTTARYPNPPSSATSNSAIPAVVLALRSAWTGLPMFPSPLMAWAEAAVAMP
jgi:hypothetical protein